MIGAFRSSLFRCVVPSAVRCLSAVVVFLDRGHPCFRKFYSTIPVDVVRAKFASLTLRVFHRLMKTSSMQSKRRELHHK